MERKVVMTQQPNTVPTTAATVDGAFRERLAASPDAVFVKCGADWLTFAQLDERTDRLAAGLAALGVGRGAMVATILPNRIETVEILLAVAKLGAVQVPLNYWLKGEFLQYQLADCGASVLIADGPGYAAAKDLLTASGITRCVAVDDPPPGGLAYPDLLAERGRFEPVSGPGDLLSIMYTSGTTAAAKGCMLSTGYYVSVGRAYGLREWCLPGERMFTGFPMFHTSGQLVAFMTALVNGASISIAPEFHASTFIADAAADGATMLVGVGVMGNLLLAQPPSPADKAHPFRLAVWVPMAEAEQRRFEERFGTPVMSDRGRAHHRQRAARAPCPRYLWPGLAPARGRDRGRRRQRAAAGRGGRDRRQAPGAERYVQRLLAQAGRHRDRLEQPVAPHRRLRADGRRRLRDVRRPQEGRAATPRRERVRAGA